MDLERMITAGMRIAVADGVGTPRSLYPALNRAAAEHGDLRLMLGWMPYPETGLDYSLFPDARTVMSGWGLRAAVDAGTVSPIVARLSAAPSLLAGRLRPDLLVATLVRTADGLKLPTEVSWMRGLIESGVRTAAVISRTAASADAGTPLPEDEITILGETDDEPREVSFAAPTPEHEAICRHAARLVPEGARVQVAPGQLGAAMLGALRLPVRVDSGLLPEGVVDLDARGLLIGEPTAAYLVGSRRLYDWADGRRILHPIEITHDLGRLSNGEPFVAFNTAVEIDAAGQVNVEGTPAAIVGGIGGHADYAAGATRSMRGLSMIAVSTTHRGRSTLVRTLSRPVSTPSQDVDVVVTERGAMDLRGMTRGERATALAEMWGPAGVRES